MYRSERVLRPLLTLFFLGVSPLVVTASLAADKTSDFSNFVDPKKIALDPVLLNTDDLGNYDLSPYAPGAASLSQPDTTQPAIKKAAISEPLSPLEKIYSDRLREPITQFGYDTFPADSHTNVSGAVQDDYILERGDEISVVLRGQQNINTTAKLSSDGQLVIGDLPPVSAAGRSLRSIQDEVKSLLGDSYNSDVFLSVTKIRQMNILVTGNVEKPGQYNVPTFGTILDALGAAGGVQKSGTLRQIKLVRSNQSALIDLYGVLVYGSGSSNLSLRDGDKIIVGPVGPTLAIAGAAKRPAIYEILPASRSIFTERDSTSQRLSLDDLLDLSGGPLLPADTRYLRFDVNGNDADKVSDVPNKMLRVFGDGDILYIGQATQNGLSQLDGSINVKGSTSLTGLFAIAETPSLSYLLRGRNSLNSDTYPLIGLIQRWNQTQMANELIPFSPQRITTGKDDVDLHESDTVYFFSRGDIARLKTPTGQDSDASLKNIEPAAGGALAFSGLPADVQNFLVEHSVFIRGSVRVPGAYPVAKDTNLESLLAVAGGPSLEASLGNVEITQPMADKTSQRTTINLASTPSSLITLHPGDTIRVNQKFRRLEDRHVLLTGEVKNPGTYDLIPGDTLNKLLERAGGLTEQAYTQGTIFSRKSERQREEQRYKAQAQSLELSLAGALQQRDDDKKPNVQEISLARDLITQLKGAEALGRLTVESDPAILESNPELDILLESDDRIYIPKRPLTVRVAGEVLSPAALQFKTGKNPRDYISEAGGFSYNADSDRAFVVYPNGSAQPLAVSAWNQSAVMIPPGSTIIVPRDPKPLTFMDGAKDLSQILANLATTAIFAEDIANGDDN